MTETAGTLADRFSVLQMDAKYAPDAIDRAAAQAELEGMWPVLHQMAHRGARNLLDVLGIVNGKLWHVPIGWLARGGVDEETRRLNGLRVRLRREIDELLAGHGS